MNQKAIFWTSFCLALIDDLLREEKPKSRRHNKLLKANAVRHEVLECYPGALDGAAIERAVAVFEKLEAEVNA